MCGCVSVCLSTHIFPGRNWKSDMKQETKRLKISWEPLLDQGLEVGIENLPFTDEKTEVSEDRGFE